MISRSTGFHFLKILVGLTIIGLLAWTVDLEELGEQIVIADPYYIFGSFVFANLLVFFQGVRQYSLLDRKVLDLLTMTRIQYVAVFFSGFMPSSLGADAYKVLSLKRYTQSYIDGGKAVFLDRIVGMLVITLCGIVCTLIEPGYFLERLPVYTDALYQSAVLVSLLVIGVLLVVAYRNTIATKWFARQRVDVRLLLASSAVVYIMQLMRFAMLAWAIGADVDLVMIGQMLLLLQFVALIPISVGGLGVIEGSIVGLLLFYGLPADEAAFLALFNRLSLILISVVGFFCWDKVKR